MSPPTKRMKSTNRTTSIEDLPPEMINELFEYLPPKHLAACSMVNRRWHSIYSNFKLHRLAVIDYDPDLNYDIIKWQGSNQPIQEAEQCHPTMFLRLAEKPLLSNLRHLAVSGSFEFDLNKLNRYQQLVHLEICMRSLGGKLHLNLPRLRVLAFHRINYGCALSIDCPELDTLGYPGESEDATLLEVKRPETIKVLETNWFGSQLAPFKGVECLVTYEFEAINKATLLSLPRLKELRYDRDIEGLVRYEFDNEVGVVDHMKRTLSEFLDEAKKLRSRDFRFTFCGFLLTNVNVDQIDFEAQVDEDDDEFEYVHNEYVYMKNYHLIIEPGALDFVQSVDYTRLLSHVTGEFPHCFFQKFTGIKEVEVQGVVKNLDHLLWFLKSLRSLRKLELGAELSQKFYDQLPAVAPSLVSLELSGQCEKTRLQLNFDFIGQFAHLSDLSIYSGLSLRSATSLVRLLGGLKEAFICVRSGGDLRIVKQRRSTVWKVQEENLYEEELIPTDQLLFETENPSEIANFFEERRAASSKTGEASD